MRLRASLLVNLTFALLARAQADNAVSVNGLSSVPRPTDPALPDLELDVDDDGDHDRISSCFFEPEPFAQLLRLASSCERLVGAGTWRRAPTTRIAWLPDVHLAYGPMLMPSHQDFGSISWDIMGRIEICFKCIFSVTVHLRSWSPSLPPLLPPLPSQRLLVQLSSAPATLAFTPSDASP
ncbi:hypothetical protein B0H10DRAFT_2434883 [Mycena sp. CBHHK59/15]|nr:hypothetical protein B0H10DRAFT_2434883 [Mycena sp. CBHHK59/15]